MQKQERSFGGGTPFFAGEFEKASRMQPDSREVRAGRGRYPDKKKRRRKKVDGKVRLCYSIFVKIIPHGGVVIGGREMKADKAKINRLLKTARGQIDGILKMVEEDRYCMDISHQLMATEAILNKANKEILTAHLKSCVTNASTDEEREEKVDELVTMLGKIL